MKPRTLNLTFSHTDFEKLLSEKSNKEKASGVRISWEDFVFEQVCGK